MRSSLLIYASIVVLMFVATGCYEVLYTAEYKGDSCIKFEDAMSEVEPDVWEEDCLGEDGVEEADVFSIDLDGYTEDIEVKVKAGKCRETITLLEDSGFWVGEACDFLILAQPDVDGWSFAVVSDDLEGGRGGTAALSNITLCFGDEVMVLGPPEGDYSTFREDEI